MTKDTCSVGDIIEGSCDFCPNGVALFERYLIHPDGPFTATRPIDGGGSDYLAVWCVACGPMHKWHHNWP